MSAKSTDRLPAIHCLKAQGKNPFDLTGIRLLWLEL